MRDPEQREEAIFNAALKLPAGQRAAYLQSACGGDAQLLANIAALFENNKVPSRQNMTCLTYCLT